MKKILLLLGSLFISYFSFSQNDTTLHNEIDEVTIESFFFKQKITTSTSPIGAITSQDFENLPLQNIGDALKLEPSISIKSDGPWATAPSLRGLSGQRVIIAVDGNRIETATDVAGGMNMININDISQIEIIKSGASSIYGSGAIGGVINFITNPVVYSSTPKIHGSLSSSYQSVNNLFGEHLNIMASNEKLYLYLSGSYRHAENTETPKGELENSQFKDYSFNAKAGFRINDQQEIRAQFQDFQARNVGVPGGDSFSDGFTVTFPEHSRIMADLQYLYTDLSESLKLLKIKGYYQNIDRQVEVKTNISKTGKPKEIKPHGEHYLFGGLAQADFEFGKQKVSTGIDIWQRNLESHRQKIINQEGDATKIICDLPLPKASYLSNGIFAYTERNFLNNKLNTTVGLRYDYIVVNNDEVYTPDYMIINGVVKEIPQRRLTIEEDTQNKNSWSANIGANYQLADGLNIALSGGHSFRAPNIEELYKYISLSDGSVQIGNADLDPEQSYFADLGIHYKHERLAISANAFINKINDMIGYKNGEAYYDNYNTNGELTSTDTVNAEILHNIDKALLYGFDANISYKLTPQILLNTSIAYTIGENKGDGGYLAEIAPMNGTVGMRYEGFEHIQGEINCEWAAKQDKIADGETETNDYGIININLNSRPFVFGKITMQAFAGIKNLSDTEYTNHLSSNRGSITVEPGRNFYAKIKIML